MSKRLCGVQFSSKANGDHRPPCHLSGISKQEQQQKEGEVFDRAIDDLCNVHWDNASFDGYPVTPFHVKCNGEPTAYSDHANVRAFLTCPLRDIRTGKYKSI